MEGEHICQQIPTVGRGCTQIRINQKGFFIKLLSPKMWAASEEITGIVNNPGLGPLGPKKEGRR